MGAATRSPGLAGLGIAACSARGQRARRSCTAMAPLRSGLAATSSRRRVLGSPPWYRVGPWPALLGWTRNAYSSMRSNRSGSVASLPRGASDAAIAALSQGGCDAADGRLGQSRGSGRTGQDTRIPPLHARWPGFGAGSATASHGAAGRGGGPARGRPSHEGSHSPMGDGPRFRAPSPCTPTMPPSTVRSGATRSARTRTPSVAARVWTGCLADFDAASGHSRGGSPKPARGYRDHR